MFFIVNPHRDSIVDDAGSLVNPLSFMDFKKDVRLPVTSLLHKKRSGGQTVDSTRRISRVVVINLDLVAFGKILTGLDCTKKDPGISKSFLGNSHVIGAQVPGQLEVLIAPSTEEVARTIAADDNSIHNIPLTLVRLPVL